MRKKRKIYRRNAALIAVLCLIFTAGLLTASMLALSQSGTFTMRAHVELQRSMLIAEGAATRIQYLLAADRNLNPDDRPGEVDYTTYEYDRYLADGVEHTIDYYGEKLTFTVTDAVSGWDMSSSGYEAVLNKISGQDDADDDLTQLVDKISQQLGDYLDSDDNIRDNGMEVTDYEDAEMKPLPRNDEMQFREELLYIESFTELFPFDENGRLSNIRLAVPEDMDPLTGSISLFTATREMIDYECDLSEDELDTVMDALDRWKKQQELLSDTLDEELLNKLKSKFSTNESGAYTVIIGPSKETPQAFRKLVFSYNGFDVSGPDEQMIRYMEWNFL